jgi:hypothetical protein
MNWQDKRSVQKGDVGERIVDAFLIGRGVVPYAPIASKAHPFDRLCATEDKSRIFIAEVKTKAARKYYPHTGINERHFSEYMGVFRRYGIDVWLFFVDEHACSVYGNKLSELIKPCEILHRGKPLKYPLQERGIVFFPLEKMRHVCEIDTDAAKNLVALSERSYGY